MLKSERAAGRDAQEIAIGALAFIAGDEERLSRFLALTGLAPATLRAEAGKPEFVVAVLDHVMADEELLLAFAADRGMPPEAVARAHAELSPAPHWS